MLLCRSAVCTYQAALIIVLSTFFLASLDDFYIIFGPIWGWIDKKQPHLAPAHSFATATAELVELRYELLSHPPYSPDLAPCDFFLFPNMKKWLDGKRFTSNEQVIAATEAHFAEFDKPYFLDGLKKLEYRWTKCIELKEDYKYIEKLILKSKKNA